MAKISGLVCDICGKRIHGNMIYRLMKPVFSVRYYDIKHNYDFCEDCSIAIIVDVQRMLKEKGGGEGCEGD